MATDTRNCFKYTRAELTAAVSNRSKAKKFAGVSKRGSEFYVGGKQIVPIEDHTKFLQALYDDPITGYAGRDRLFWRVQEKYTGISRRDISAFLANFEVAQIHQQPKNVRVSRPVVLRKPMSAWACDLTWLKEIDQESLTNVEKESQVLFTCVDMFSKYAFARLLPNKSAKVVAGAMDEILKAEGAPATMRTDNGSEFISNEWKAVMATHGIRHIFSPTYAPNANAMIERFNKTIKDMTYRYMTEWNLRKIDQAAVSKIVQNYNNCRHSTTHQVPARVHGGNEDAVWSARKEIKARAVGLLEKNKQNFPELRVGDTVRLAKRTVGEWRKERQLKKYSSMTQWLYELFKVADIKSSSKVMAEQYKLLGPDGKMIDRLFLRQDLQKIDPRKLIKELEKGEFVVDFILDKKMVGGVPKYLVRWKGYNEDYDSWEVAQPGYQRAIDAWEKDHPKPVVVEPKPVAKPTPKKVVASAPKTPTPKTPAATTTRSGRVVRKAKKMDL